MDWDLLKKLSETPGMPSAEDAIIEIMRDEFSKISDDVTVDNMGNIFAHIPGDGPTLMLDAHMDEVGFMVKSIDKKGFIRVIPLGGIDPKVFYASRVIVHGREDLVGVVGATPPHLGGDKQDITPIEDCFIDVGLSGETVSQLVRIGDLVSFFSPCIETQEAFIAKAFDDRMGLFVMLEAMKMVEKQTCDLWLVGTVQEEKGMRGAGPAAFQVNPDLAISLEGTVASDTPGVAPHKMLAVQGKGPEVRFGDRAFLADRKWVHFIEQIANEREIPVQLIVKNVGGTNSSHVQTHGAGVRTTALSVPVRYLHSPNGVARKDDIINTAKLIAAIIEETGRF